MCPFASVRLPTTGRVQTLFSYVNKGGEEHEKTRTVSADGRHHGRQPAAHSGLGGGGDRRLEHCRFARNLCAMTAAGKYKLTKDITVSAPYASNFTGIFDGDGHTITVNIKGNGLFSIIGDATIQNLKVDGIITGSSINVGGIVGKTQGAAKIDSCTFNGTVSSTSTNAKAGVGGIVGRVNTGTLTIINCYNTASVTSKKYAGGILGASTAAGTTITNCFNIGVISGTAGSGGIVGNLTNSKSSVSNCYWIQPEAGRGNGTAPINNGKTDSIVSVLVTLAVHSSKTKTET